MTLLRPVKPYQEEGARFLAAWDRGILADAPGLGKTVQTLLALDLAGIGPLSNVLVVAPLSVLPCWKKEAIKWTEWRRFTIVRRNDSITKTPGHTLVPWTDLVVMKDRLMQIKWDVVILDEAHRLKQMASDGQPGWGEVVRDLVGPPTLPLDSPETPGIVFGEANKETRSDLSNPPCANVAQKEPTVSQNQVDLHALSKIMAELGESVSRFSALLSRMATANAAEETAKTTVKIDLRAPCTTLGAGAIAAVSTAVEKPAEKVQPHEQAIATVLNALNKDPVNAAALEALSDPDKLRQYIKCRPSLAPVPPAEAAASPCANGSVAAKDAPAAKEEPKAPVGEVAPLTFAEFSAFLPKFLGDPVGDKANYEARRASVYRECSAAAGVTEKILPAKLTDAQRGLVAVRLGFTK